MATPAQNVPAPSGLTCRGCGHTWEPRVAEPQCCPRCKRYDWREKEENGGESKDDTHEGQHRHLPMGR